MHLIQIWYSPTFSDIASFFVCYCVSKENIKYTNNIDNAPSTKADLESHSVGLYSFDLLAVGSVNISPPYRKYIRGL